MGSQAIVILNVAHLFDSNIFIFQHIVKHADAFVPF
jgi:hypothetical protein